MIRRLGVSLLAAALLAPASAGAVRLETVASFDQPTFLGAPRDAGSLAFVTEREGRIKLLDGSRKAGTFLNITGLVGCCEVETGLFSVAFAPDYERSRRFYVYFTNNERNIEIDEFRSSRKHPRRADPRTRRKLLEIPQSGEVNHNGGQLAFGPDRFLYLATGDGGRFDDPSDASQRKGSLLGKLLRINPRRGKNRPYGVPPGNPYVGRAGRDEIYARGLRNPFRFSFDRGRILIGDVGQARREEVDVERIRRANGANFGWNIFEGTLRFRPGKLARHDKPVHQYPHFGGNCSITGGYVLRDPRLKRLAGRYVYGDYCSGAIRSFIPRPNGSADDRPLGVGSRPGIVSFGEDARDRLYTVVLETGKVSRLVPGG